MKALSTSKVLILAAITTAFAQNPPASQPPKPPVNPAPPTISQPVRVAPGTGAVAPATPAAPPVDVPADAVVFTVGDEKVTRAQFEKWASNLPDNYKMAVTGPQKRKFVEQFTELKALAQEARNRKLDQKPTVMELIAIQTDQLLASQLVQDLKPDDAAMKAYYDQHKAEFEQAKARHILIGVKGGTPSKDKKELTDEEALAKAKEVREKIVKGGDFATLAKAESYDPGSLQTGGEYNVSHGQMVKEFDAAVWSLPIGQVSDPVKTQFGYHIIRVESRTAKTFEEVKPQIEAKLKPEIAKKAVDEAKKQVPITINDDYFGK